MFGRLAQIWTELCIYMIFTIGYKWISFKECLASPEGFGEGLLGQVAVCFGMSIALCLVTSAKLCGLFQGLCLVWDRSIRHLIAAEMDNQCVSRLISSTRLVPNAHFSPIIAINGVDEQIIAHHHKTYIS